MADLRQFQNRPQAQANLQQVSPVVPPSTTSLQQLGSFFQGSAGALTGAIAAGQQAEAQQVQDTTLGKFASSLARAQQASQTDPTADLSSIQRKLYLDFVSANPSLGADAIKVFNDATGVKVAGLSTEQQFFQEQQEAAWKSGFGSPLATEEENAKQFQLYQNIQRESKVMEFEAKQDVHDKRNQLKKFQGSTAKLASWKTESLNETLQQDIEKIKNGGDRLEFEMKWAKLRVDWANTVAQYGEFANDPTIKAQLSGITGMFDLADKVVSGQAELDALTKQSSIAVAKQKAMISSDPKNAQIIATSEFFGHTPALNLPVAAAATEILKEGPADLREVGKDEQVTTKKTLESMTQSETPAARDEATGHVVSIAEHLERNGMDYTDENILDVCNVMAVPSAFNNMTAEDKDIVKRACDTYASDVAMKAIREIERNGSITFPTEVVTPRGDTRPGAGTPTPVQEFATLTTDNTGLRYIALPSHSNNRQVQRRIQDLNRQLAKVNPIVEVYSAATGESPAYIANTLWGLGNDQRSQADIAAERDLGPSVEVDATVNPEPEAPLTNSEEFRTGFIEEAISQGSTQEEAEALWEQISTPSEEPLVDIGGMKVTPERAREILSTPARQIMRLFLLVLVSLVMVGCASTATPIDIPVDIVTGGDVRDVNTSITTSVQNIVSHLEWWHMATVVGLAWLVGWLSPGPMEMIRGFFSGLGAVITGFRGLW